MTLHRLSKLEAFEERHPGAFRQVEAMLKAFISVRRIAAVLLAQYGERIGHNTLLSYRRDCWDVWRQMASR
jgi:hypothetical protein